MSDQRDRDAVRRGPPLPAASRVRCAGEREAGDLRRSVRGVLGAGGPRARHAGSSRSRHCSSGSSRTRSGTAAGRSTSPTTASTATSRPVSANRVAFYYEGEPVGERAAITYSQLLDEVVRAANGLKALGVGKGTPVGIYMGMGPGLPVAMLACARLGAPHTVVFGGFSAEALADRLNDMRCEVLLTQDESYRRGALVPLKRNADEALESCPGVRTVVVGQRTRGDVPMTEGRDLTWNELVDGQSTDPASCPCEPMDSEDLLYLLYTSGTTAKPKGIAHTTAGYLVGVGGHSSLRLRPEARGRRLLVRRRHRLGDGAQLHRLRAALQRRDERPVRGDARLPGQGPLVGHRRALQGHDPVHGADGDPRAHEVGARARGEARPHLAPAPRLRRRADQPRGVDVVPRAHRARAHADRGHVVADRDRDDPHHAAPRCHDDEARLRDEAVPGHRSRRRRRPRQRRRPGRRRLPRAEAAMAGDDARDLRRRRALPRDILGAFPGAVLRGGRRAHRRRTGTSGSSAASTT